MWQNVYIHWRASQTAFNCKGAVRFFTRSSSHTNATRPRTPCPRVCHRRLNIPLNSSWNAWNGRPAFLLTPHKPLDSALLSFATLPHPFPPTPSPLRPPPLRAHAFTHTLHFSMLNIAQVNPTLEHMWLDGTTNFHSGGLSCCHHHEKWIHLLCPAACVYPQTRFGHECDLGATRPSTTLTGLKGQNGTRERLMCHNQVRPEDEFTAIGEWSSALRCNMQSLM